MLFICGRTRKTPGKCRADGKGLVCSESWPTITRPRVISQTTHAFLVLVTYLASRVNRTTTCIRYYNDQSQQGQLFRRAERCARASLREVRPSREVRWYLSEKLSRVLVPTGDQICNGQMTNDFLFSRSNVGDPGRCGPELATQRLRRGHQLTRPLLLQKHLALELISEQ